MAAAARHGRFAIVTVWPVSMNFVPQGLLRAYGHEQACLGIRNVGEETVIGAVAGPDGYLSQVTRVDSAILERVVAEVLAAAEAGAQAVMLGCTCMSAMAARVAELSPIPVINPLAEAAKSAATAAPSGPAIRTDRADLITRMVAAIAGEADENCPVCAAAESA